jgi:hypothetical protein
MRGSVKPTKLELMQFFIQCVRVDAARIGPAEVRMRYGVDPERCRMSLRGAAIRPSSCPVRPILHVRTGISGGGRFSALAKELRLYRLIAKRRCARCATSIPLGACHRAYEKVAAQRTCEAGSRSTASHKFKSRCALEA